MDAQADRLKQERAERFTHAQSCYGHSDECGCGVDWSNADRIAA